MFWGDSDLTVVPPSATSSTFGNPVTDFSTGHTELAIFHFEHSREFYVTVSEEFMEYCAEGALSIEVYGHRSAGLESQRWAERQQLAKSLADRWVDMNVLRHCITLIQSNPNLVKISLAQGHTHYTYARLM